mmetsp:Transcript_42135/g.112394  ORF Transcript_42135/g.112394 Transcript_42135/m.112394 type:complete len:113 (-) Transcript_42135:230-568(-)
MLFTEYASLRCADGAKDYDGDLWFISAYHFLPYYGDNSNQCRGSYCEFGGPFDGVEGVGSYVTVEDCDLNNPNNCYGSTKTFHDLPMPEGKERKYTAAMAAAEHAKTLSAKE